jgi:hypothetical protein
MASGIGGNHFNLVQQHLAKGPEASTLENLRQAGGTAASQSKELTSKGKPAPTESGLHLSEAAKKSLQSNHEEHIHGQEHELAHQAGLGDELQPESRHEQHVERGNQRHQDTLKQQTGQPQPPPPASAGPDTADKVQARLTAAKMAAYDDPDTLYQRVLEDIPEANMEAAERVLESQMKQQGMKKMSNLKSGPEAQEAGRMEMRQADFMSAPLDIRDSDNDRSMPMPLEFPDEMTEVAREKAAEALAAGEIEQENLLAGP